MRDTTEAAIARLRGGQVLDWLVGAEGLSERFQLVVSVAFILLALLVPTWAGSVYWLHVSQLICLFTTVAVFQNTLLSEAAQISFGQGAIFGAAAYTVGIVTGLHGAPYIVGAVSGVIASMVLGLIFALPALRVQGYYLGFVTVSAAVVFPQMLIAFNEYTNGVIGIAVDLPAMRGEIAGGITVLTLAVAAASIAAFALHFRLRSSSLGRRLFVAGKSPEAAMSLGFRPGVLRFTAFLIAAVGTGAAGVLYVPVMDFLSPQSFNFELSAFFFFAVVVGGKGKLLGPVAGVLVLYLLPNVLLVDLVNYRLIAYGVAALIIMLLFSDGLVGTFDAGLRKLRVTSSVRKLDVPWFRTQIGTTIVGGKQPTLAGHSAPAIAVVGLCKAYGSVRALDAVSVQVGHGTVHGLVGPNGSGKTTLLNLISGFAAPEQGTISINGADVTGARAYTVAAHRVGRTFQTPRVFEALSIRDNLQIGLDARGVISGTTSHAKFIEGDAAWSSERPDVLPHAQRRLLELFRVMLTDADILLFDEPAAGLSPDEREELAALIRLLSQEFDKTILIVEHDLHLVWSIADEITVLDAGRVVARGDPDRVKSDPQVQSLFTGAESHNA